MNYSSDIIAMDVEDFIWDKCDPDNMYKVLDFESVGPQFFSERPDIKVVNKKTGKEFKFTFLFSENVGSLGSGLPAGHIYLYGRTSNRCPVKFIYFAKENYLLENFMKENKKINLMVENKKINTPPVNNPLFNYAWPNDNI